MYYLLCEQNNMVVGWASSYPSLERILAKV
jgi:hypothetical protein